MGKFLAVFKREYLERVRTKSFLIVSVFGPLLLGAIMIVPAVIANKQMKAARLDRLEIIDASNVGLGAEVRAMLIVPRADSTQTLADSATLTVTVVAPSGVAQAESLATEAVMKKRLSGYVVLDSATVAGSTARYAGREASSVGQMDMLSTAIRQTVLRKRLIKEGLDPARIAALTQMRLRVQTERISDKGRGGSGVASTVLGFAMAFILYVSLIFYGQNILRSVLEEKTTRVAEVIVASVKTDILLTGKVLGVVAVSMTQMVFWAVSATIMYFARSAIFAKFGLQNATAFTLPHVSPWLAVAFFLLFMLGFIFYASLFAAAGATVSSDQEAQQAAQPIMMMIVASIIFLNPILVAPMSTIAKVLSWLPFSAPIVMPLRMSVTPLDPMEIALVLLGLAVACAASIWVSARIYRVGLLMYGKKPSFRELGRWIAQS
jgi:ABC-2 type transport system permease protein